MKKMIVSFLFAVFSLGILSAEEQGQVLARLYNSVTDLEQKYSAMQKMVRLDDPSLELTYINALSELLEGEYYSSSTGENKDLWYDLTLMILREVGEIKAQDAARLAHIVMRDYDGLLRSEAMISLGSMKAVEYTEEMATALRNINFNQRSDKDKAQTEAYGAILGLNRMGDIRGFEAVFYAHIGWYNRRVRGLAERTLKEMVPDPTEELLKIMATANADIKLVALQSENESDASVENKNKAAAFALEEGVTLQGASVEEKVTLRNLRLLALDIIIENKASIEETVPYLQRAYDEAFSQFLASAGTGSDSQEELIKAVEALGINGSEPAVLSLVNYLEYFHEKKRGGVSPNRGEELLLRQIIYGLGICGNGELALPALSAVEIYDYSNSINRAAKNAMKNYQ